jgi:SAM-dependent methyltransferase
MADSLVDYYSQRAAGYDAVWQRADPERQTEQRAIATAMQALFRKRRVLEVACGTGYWTQFLAETAASITAVDAAPAMLDLARKRDFPQPLVSWIEGDAYNLTGLGGPFEGGLANFWISHVPKRRLDGFLRGFHANLAPGAVVFLADNVFVEGLGGQLVSHPDREDTFKLRRRNDGTGQEVLKNYYGAEELNRMLTPYAAELDINVGSCFWWAQYRLP